MLQNFLLTVNVVIPIFIFIFIGFFLKERKIISEVAITSLNSIVFSLLLPANLIRNLMNSDLSTVINPKLLLFTVIGYILSAVVMSFIAPLLTKDRKEMGSIVQCTFRGNIVLMGLALATNLCGAEGAAVMTSLIAFMVPVLNVISVVVLSYFSGTGKFSIKKILLNIVKNPLIIGCLIGTVISLWNIPLHDLIKNTIVDLSDCSTPIAMLLIGAQFDIKSVSVNIKKDLVACLMKLVVFPVAAIAAGYVLGFRGAELGCAFVIFAAPSAASSAIQAQAEGCDGAIAGEILLMTTLLSVFTLFAEVFMIYTTGILGINI